MSRCIVVLCHACARTWEVIHPDEWMEQTKYADCAYCGRVHTAEECLDTEVRTVRRTDKQVQDLIEEEMEKRRR